MNVLVLGSGGREHTLAWKLSQSPRVNQLYIAPGNGGTEAVAKNVDIGVNDFESIGSFCLENEVQWVVVGPEGPLVRGIVDYFNTHEELTHIKVFGPDSNGAQLEGSKDFSKRFMAKHGIPTAAYQSFDKNSLEAGKQFLETLEPPYVLKADGLAAGKGVLILNNLEEAQTELGNMLSGKFGEASSRVVVEEYLHGIEFSVFAITDGQDYVILPEAKDYKRIGEGDTGLNTGGMGAVSPVPFVDDALMQKVEEQIVKPTIEGISKERMNYKGFVFFGLTNVGGEPYVIEYNARMGDPETEVVIPRLQNDLMELLEGCFNGKLGELTVQQDRRVATTIMTVSEGYPEAYEKGKAITGLEKVEESIVFHAGTKTGQESIVTNGGRIMAFTSFGNSMQEALEKSYGSINKVCFEGITYRKDIGFDL